MPKINSHRKLPGAGGYSVIAIAALRMGPPAAPMDITTAGEPRAANAKRLKKITPTEASPARIAKPNPLIGKLYCALVVVNTTPDPTMAINE